MDEIEKIARDSFFKQPEMVEHLLAENLALKMLLYEKNVFTQEEYKKYQVDAKETLNQKLQEYILNWKEKNSGLLDAIAKKNIMKNDH